MLANLLMRARDVVLGVGLLLWSVVASAAFEVNMTEGVTPVSQEVYHLHMLIFWICVAIGLVVFGVMFYSIYHHRKSRGAVAAQFHESTAVEIAWTVVPMVILISMAIPATKALIAMEDTAEPDMTIQVTGYQWKWKYDYLDDGISFFSNLSTPRQQIYNLDKKDAHYLLEVDHPMVVPVGKKIQILTTAADVIHSWWVPALGWKRDAIPGYINKSWAYIEKPGVYRGQCAELCGKDHGYMPIVVDAKSPEDYAKWVASMKEAQVAETESANRQWSQQELMTKGEEVYQTHCVACHQAKGEGVPGVFPPLLAGQPFSAADSLLQPLRERGFLDENNKIVMGPVDQHIGIVLGGIPGTAMQPFAGQLSDAEIAAVITYERNSWGNDTGDTVQPENVKAQR